MEQFKKFNLNTVSRIDHAMIFRIAFLSILLICSGCIPFPDNGTPHLSGSVVDSTTKHPIANARLHYAEFPKHDVYTGFDGRYDFPSIRYWKSDFLFVDSDGPPHRSILTVEAPMYFPINVELDAWPDRTNLSFYLNHQ
jgi:hypothetical protein